MWSCGRRPSLFLSTRSDTVPEKVISACWMWELPAGKDKTSCLSFSILLPVHWPPSISRPPPCFCVLDKKLMLWPKWTESWVRGVSGVERVHPLGEWASAWDFMTVKVSWRPAVPVTEGKLTWSCRPPQTSGVPLCSELTTDTSGHVAGSPGNLKKQKVGRSRFACLI